MNTITEATRKQAAIQAQQARTAADDTAELLKWIDLGDRGRDEARSFPWLAAHVAKMDAMISHHEHARTPPSLWIPIGIKPLKHDSYDGWVVYIDANGRLYFNFWNYDWSTSPKIKIVAWCPIPFWSGQGLAKQDSQTEPHP